MWHKGIESLDCRCRFYLFGLRCAFLPQDAFIFYTVSLHYGIISENKISLLVLWIDLE